MSRLVRARVCERGREGKGEREEIGKWIKRSEREREKEEEKEGETEVEVEGGRERKREDEKERQTDSHKRAEELHI